MVGYGFEYVAYSVRKRVEDIAHFHVSFITIAQLGDRAPPQTTPSVRGGWFPLAKGRYSKKSPGNRRRRVGTSLWAGIFHTVGCVRYAPPSGSRPAKDYEPRRGLLCELCMHRLPLLNGLINSGAIPAISVNLATEKVAHVA